MSLANSTRRIRLLILDEDRVYGQSLAGSLREEGYDVRATESPADALASLQAGGPELLLAEVNTSGLDPAEFLRDVRRSAPGTVVVVVTAFGSIEGAVQATRGGAFAYLTKPASAREVRPIVDRAARQFWLLSGSGAPQQIIAPADAASGIEAPGRDAIAAGEPPGPLQAALERSEREIILAALERYGWNRRAAAGGLGIDRATLYKKMRKHGLDGPGPGQAG